MAESRGQNLYGCRLGPYTWHIKGRLEAVTHCTGENALLDWGLSRPYCDAAAAAAAAAAFLALTCLALPCFALYVFSAPGMLCSFIITRAYDKLHTFICRDYIKVEVYIGEAGRVRISSITQAHASMWDSLIVSINETHKLGLQDCLAVFGHVPITKAVKHVKLMDIDTQTSTFTLRFLHTETGQHIEKIVYFIDNDSGNDTRTAAGIKQIFDRMFRIAAEKRHLSPVQVATVEYPCTLVDWLILVGVTLPALCYLHRPVLHCIFSLVPNPVGATLETWLNSDRVLLLIILAEFVTHALETVFFIVPRLKYYRVPGEFVPEWLLLGLLEGYGPARRLDAQARALGEGSVA